MARKATDGPRIQICFVRVPLALALAHTHSLPPPTHTPGFLTQFGITPDMELRKHWREQGPIPDDPNQHRQILRGYLSFAGGGANTRDMQLFIALSDSDWLGKAPWEVPVGRVIYGMDDVIDKLYAVGEIHPFDETGVKQGRIWSEGNDYLHREFPKVSPSPDI